MCRRVLLAPVDQGATWAWLDLLRHASGHGLRGVELHRLSPAGFTLLPVLLRLEAFEDGESLGERLGVWEEKVVVD